MSKTKKSAGFDLCAFDTKTAAEEGQEFEVIHPKTGPTGLFIGMKGTHSEQVKTELRRIANRAKAARGGTVRKNEDEEGAQFLASISTSIRLEGPDGESLPVVMNGETIEFSVANMKRVYIEYPLIAEQATEFAFDSVNFLQG